MACHLVICFEIVSFLNTVWNLVTCEEASIDRLGDLRSVTTHRAHVDHAVAELDECASIQYRYDY